MLVLFEDNKWTALYKDMAQFHVMPRSYEQERYQTDNILNTNCITSNYYKTKASNDHESVLRFESVRNWSTRVTEVERYMDLIESDEF